MQLYLLFVVLYSAYLATVFQQNSHLHINLRVGIRILLHMYQLNIKTPGNKIKNKHIIGVETKKINTVSNKNK
jgi:hypothetical protein